LRVDLIQRLEGASLSLAPAVRRRLLTFVVVGGGIRTGTCGGSAAEPSARELAASLKRCECRKDELKPWGFQLATNKVISVAASAYDLRARR
jgi:hypothetical protein